MLKAKTKRRIKHLLTKKKLVKKRTSRHVMRSFAVVLTTICTGSLAYATVMTKPTVTVAVQGVGPNGRTISAPSTPTPASKPLGTGAPDQVGRGSWYALGLPAPDSLTCASRTFPRGSYLQVKNLNNNHTVICRVNDYGPEAWTGRVIDLSRGSFRQIEDLGRGTIPVEIRLTTNTTGYNLPINADIMAAVVGYNLCHSQHTAEYCEQHRQD